MNNSTILVFDFETGSVNPETCEVIQVAAMALHPRSLAELGQYTSLIKPRDFSKLEKEALEINKKSIEELEKAPDLSIVWKSFTSFIKKYNPKPGNTFFAPIAAGKNIRHFDMIIINRLAREFGDCDKYGRQNLFNKRSVFDLDDFVFYWFDNSNELRDHKMDTLREYFGMSTENAHDALVDVKQTATLLKNFIQLHRKVAAKVNFKNSLADNLERTKGFSS